MQNNRQKQEPKIDQTTTCYDFSMQLSTLIDSFKWYITILSPLLSWQCGESRYRGIFMAIYELAFTGARYA